MDSSSCHASACLANDHAAWYDSSSAYGNSTACNSSTVASGYLPIASASSYSSTGPLVGDIPVASAIGYLSRLALADDTTVALVDYTTVASGLD